MKKLVCRSELVLYRRKQNELAREGWISTQVYTYTVTYSTNRRVFTLSWTK